VVFFIVLFVRVTLIGRSITSHGRNIDHSSSEFDECSPGHTINTEWKLGIPFDGKFQVCYIVETEIDELLVLFLAQVMDESLPFSTLQKTVEDTSAGSLVPCLYAVSPFSAKQ
jgi:hypothetical protein